MCLHSVGQNGIQHLTTNPFIHMYLLTQLPMEETTDNQITGILLHSLMVLGLLTSSTSMQVMSVVHIKVICTCY